jgi:hypothetical protein
VRKIKEGEQCEQVHRALSHRVVLGELGHILCVAPGRSRRRRVKHASGDLGGARRDERAAESLASVDARAPASRGVSDAAALAFLDGYCWLTMQCSGTRAAEAEAESCCSPAATSA